MNAVDFDRTKSLQELENHNWSEPNFDSHLVTECHRLHRIPLKDLTVENLRIMIGQNISLGFLMPLALEKLRGNPLAEGDYYAGDLLVNVLLAEADYWRQNPRAAVEIEVIAARALAEASIAEIEKNAVKDALAQFASRRPGAKL